MPEAPADGEITIVLEENVGPVPVVVRFEGGVPVFANSSVIPSINACPLPWIFS